MHVCLFDIDGTLLSSGGAGRAAMEDALAVAFGVPPSSDGIRMSGRTDRSIGKDLFKLHGIEDTTENWQRFVTAYLRCLPGSLSRHDGRVLPGIAVLLEQLVAMPNIFVGLLTGNLRDGARLKLGHFNLFQHFAFGGFGDVHLCRNEVARETWEIVHQRCNGTVAKENVWVIGDTPLDIECARCIGVRVAAVATGGHPQEELAAGRPDLLLADFSDASPLLAMWDNN